MKWRRAFFQKRRLKVVRHYIGLDVALGLTAICIVDESGATVLQAEIKTGAGAIAASMGSYRRALVRVAHEAGPGGSRFSLQSLGLVQPWRDERGGAPWSR